MRHQVLCGHVVELKDLLDHRALVGFDDALGSSNLRQERDFRLVRGECRFTLGKWRREEVYKPYNRSAF